MTFTNTINQVLTRNRIRELAPSVFAESHKDGLTSKYNFIPTVTVMNELENKGWLPVKVTETRARAEDNRGYQKHMIRFRNFNEQNNQQNQLAVGDTFVELVLTNSHNGLSAFVFDAGLFRLACANGMVVSENCFDSAHIRHNSYDSKNVLQICDNISDRAPLIITEIEKMRAIDLEPVEEVAFANAAKTLRFEKPEEIEAHQVLKPRRRADEGHDLWSVTNRIQENLLKGGIYQNKFNEAGRYTGSRRTREVGSIDGNIKLNKAIWTLAEEMMKHKASH